MDVSRLTTEKQFLFHQVMKDAERASHEQLLELFQELYFQKLYQEQVFHQMVRSGSR